MSRLIDADALWEELGILYHHNNGEVNWNDAILEIKAAPTIEPERKKGKWIRHNTYHGDDTSGSVDPDWRCSECGTQATVNAWLMYDLTDFCPNCGCCMK